MRTFKSITARVVRQHFPNFTLWQRSFHDHAVRGEADYREIWEYVDGNPAKWNEDRFYPDAPITT